MYAREIAGTAKEKHEDAQWKCADCAASPHEWDLRGRCTEPLPDGGIVQLRMEISGVSQSAVYPEEFATCPMGLMRPDINGDALDFAYLVSHATSADVGKRWPDVPARLYAGIQEWIEADAGKQNAETDARAEGRKGHGTR